MRYRTTVDHAVQIRFRPVHPGMHAYRPPERARQPQTETKHEAAKARGDLAGLNALVRDQARWVLGATALVGAGTVIAAPLLLGLFGPEFRDMIRAAHQKLRPRVKV